MKIVAKETNTVEIEIHRGVGSHHFNLCVRRSTIGLDTYQIDEAALRQAVRQSTVSPESVAVFLVRGHGPDCQARFEIPRQALANALGAIGLVELAEIASPGNEADAPTRNGIPGPYATA
jgi:hypothetical protein